MMEVEEGRLKEVVIGGMRKVYLFSVGVVGVLRKLDSLELSRLKEILLKLTCNYHKTYCFRPKNLQSIGVI